MSLKAVDVSKITSELHEVLAKNEVPIGALDNILKELKNTIYTNTTIRSKISRSENRTIIKG